MSTAPEQPSVSSSRVIFNRDGLSLVEDEEVMYGWEGTHYVFGTPLNTSAERQSESPSAPGRGDELPPDTTQPALPMQAIFVDQETFMRHQALTEARRPKGFLSVDTSTKHYALSPEQLAALTTQDGSPDTAPETAPGSGGDPQPAH
jgi:hypothetical protein